MDRFPRIDLMALGLAYLFGAGGLLAILTVLQPHEESTNDLGVLIPGLLAVGGCAYILLAGRSLPPWGYGALLSFGTTLVAACVWYGGASAESYAFFYLWVALYACHFFRARVATLLTGYGVASLAFVLLVREPAETPAVLFTMVSGTAFVVGTLTGGLTRLVRRHESDLEAVRRLANQMSTSADLAQARQAVCEAARRSCGAAAVVLREGEERRPTAQAGDAHVSQRLSAVGRAELTAPTRREISEGGRVHTLVEPVRLGDRVAAALVIGWDPPVRALSPRVSTAAGLFATQVGVALEREERLSGERERRALEINDNIVQGLAVAKYSLAAGREDEGARALDDTLARARELISRQLDRGVDQRERELAPGDLRRDRPGSV